MAKTISAPLKAHLASNLTSLCTCIQMTRRDGTEFFFTDLDQDLVIGSDTYLSAVGYQRTAIATDSVMTVDNLDITGIFDDDTLTETDLRSGLFDFAELRVFVVNWLDLTMDQLKMRRATLGEISAMPSGLFSTQLRGMFQLLQLNLGSVYQPTCRADLGDDKCTIDLVGGGWQKAATVATVTDAQNFTLTITEARAIDGWFAGGVAKFTSGANSGRAMEVKQWTRSTNAVKLFLPMPATVAVGNTLVIYPGCNKTVAHCRDKFNNIVNMRAEPYVPGTDAILQTPVSVG